MGAMRWGGVGGAEPRREWTFGGGGHAVRRGNVKGGGAAMVWENAAGRARGERLTRSAPPDRIFARANSAAVFATYDCGKATKTLRLRERVESNAS